MQHKMWEIVEEEAYKTNCKDRAVGCVIYDTMAQDIVGKGHNQHIDTECDCDTTKTAIHAEAAAIANIHSKRLKAHLIAFVNHKPCCKCVSLLDEVVSEVRYRSQK